MIIKAIILFKGFPIFERMAKEYKSSIVHINDEGILETYEESILIWLLDHK